MGQERGSVKNKFLHDTNYVCIANLCLRPNSQALARIGGIIMDIDERNAAIDAVIKILDRYGIKNLDDWYNQDEEEGAELYEDMKAGVVEMYNIDDDDMGEILDEVLGD